MQETKLVAPFCVMVGADHLSQRLVASNVPCVEQYQCCGVGLAEFGLLLACIAWFPGRLSQLSHHSLSVHMTHDKSR